MRKNIVFSSFAAAALSMPLLSAPPAWAQAPYDGCPTPEKPVQIEVLPLPAPLTGDTCTLHNNTMTHYSPPCGINGAAFTNPEAVYKVWLHEGNRDVEFNLTVTSGDLALALVKVCTDTNNACQRSSDGPGNEKLSKQNYLPGIYYLSIDAAAAGGHCGKYTLTVTGINPVPVLMVTLKSVPKPVKAGNKLTYTLTVTNEGALDATEMQATLILPSGVSVPTIPGCSVSGTPKTVVCTKDSLNRNETFTKKFDVTVASSTRGKLTSTAKAIAREGDQNPPSVTDETTANARIRPRHHRRAPRPYPGGTKPRPG
ncbi:MAG TPA: hypothetical protein VF173_14810 [Thermoanaerobaculia bacterium]|nr:hypothetical protein [Thermoanaerobaculia bacterium]